MPRTRCFATLLVALTLCLFAPTALAQVFPGSIGGGGGGGGGVGTSSDTELLWNNASTVDGAAGLTTDGTDLTIASGGQLFLPDGTSTNPALLFSSDANTLGIYRDSPHGALVMAHSGGPRFFFANLALGGFALSEAYVLGWSSSTEASTSNIDVALRRDAAGILAQRNGTNAQTLRVYGTYANGGADYEAVSIDAGVTAADTVTITPIENGTGADDQTLELNSIGTAGDIVLDASDDIFLDAGGQSVIFQRNGSTLFSAALSTGVNSAPLVVFQPASNISDTTGDTPYWELNATFAPASGTPRNQFLSLKPTINWGGTPGAGSYEALHIDVTETAIPTGTNYLIRGQVGAADQWGILSSGLEVNSIEAGITASTTQTQGQQPLTKNVNEVATVANTNDTVTMRSAIAGICQVVLNNGANTLQIFPATGDDLGSGVDTAVTLPSGSNRRFCAYDATNWEVI
jgi:hypothetical protein